jgi:hypothetical protein
VEKLHENGSSISFDTFLQTNSKADWLYLASKWYNSENGWRRVHLQIVVLVLISLHIDDPDDPWPRRVDSKEARGPATLNAALEISLSSDDEELVERSAGVVISTHLPPPVCGQQSGHPLVCRQLPGGLRPIYLSRNRAMPRSAHSKVNTRHCPPQAQFGFLTAD